MSRTYKKDPPKWWRKEKKELRKRHYKSYRQKSNQLLRSGEEVMPRHHRTSGWLTH